MRILLALFMAVASPLFAAAGTLKMSVEVKKGNEIYIPKKGGATGEFSQDFVEKVGKLASEGTGVLSKYTFEVPVDERMARGTNNDQESKSELIEDNGKYYWKTYFVFVDDRGLKTSKTAKHEVEFTKGDWSDYESGKDVVFQITAKEKSKRLDEIKKEVREGLEAFMAEAESDTGLEFSSPKETAIVVKGEYTFEGNMNELKYAQPYSYMEVFVEAN